MQFRMSEDEFVVLAEHAGLVDAFDGSDDEFVERSELLAWLEREGIALLRDRHSLSPDDDPPTTEGGTDNDDAIAREMLERMLSKKWLKPVENDAGDGGGQDKRPDPPRPVYYTLRLRTTDAYQIYIDKDTDSSVYSRTWSGRSLVDAARREDQSLADGSITLSSSVGSVLENLTDEARQMRVREKLWQDCFPTCSDSCKQLYFSFESPVVVLYATMGLNLIGNGISSVPAFSRELKSMGISHEDRTVIVGFLSRAFPCE